MLLVVRSQVRPQLLLQWGWHRLLSVHTQFTATLLSLACANTPQAAQPLCFGDLGAAATPSQHALRSPVSCRHRCCSGFLGQQALEASACFLQQVGGLQ